MTLLSGTNGTTFEPYGVPPFPVTRFTVEKYQRLIESGALDEDEPVELIHGWITPKMPHSPPHDSTVTRGQRQLRTRLGDTWTIRAQCSIQLADSQPEPDLAVAIGPDDRYDERHPTPSDLILVVQVAESSLKNDRDVKGPMYAAAGIRTYWIVNLAERQLEVYTDPTGPGSDPKYQSRRDYKPDEAVTLVGFEDAPAPVAVRDLLPKTP
jgi:Uma2 family endonuclease